MPSILPNILSLIQYINVLNTPEACRPDKCPYCKRARPHRHGEYSRKGDRENPHSESLNPIKIQRVYCTGCGKTSSVLPECMPPNRWYLWDVQQTIIMLFLSGKSAYAIEKETAPSRHTIKRWIVRLHDQFLSHKDTLSSQFSALGRTSGFAAFWQACFQRMSLGGAMRLCHVAGVFIP